MGLVGCANQSAPPGGPEDRRPPVVVRTEPDTFAVLLDPNGQVRFHFDERISENVADGDLSSAVTVSPATGDIRVSHGRSAITVSLEGGFRPGLVYRVTLLPVVSDLYGNRMREAVEVVFNTGTDVAPTATLAGEVWDRLSGQGVNGAVVRAVGADSLVHVARTNDQGVFALRYLPAGDFVLTGFQDSDRDREVGVRESQGNALASLAAGDTLVLDIAVLAPDTTPAIAGTARALDSVTVVVEFDDYLDPAAPAEEIGVRLTREGGDGAPSIARVFHEGAYQRYVDQLADSFARLDSLDAVARAEQAAATELLAVDTLADSLASAPSTADSVAVPGDDAEPDTLAERPDARPAVQPRPLPPRLAPVPGAQGPAPAGRLRPGRRIVGQLDGPLEPDVDYQLRVTAAVNINGLPGGEGEVTLRYEPPPPARDTATVDGVDDSDAAAPGGQVAPDTAAVADTLGVMP